jgi:hypothetical protein
MGAKEEQKLIDKIIRKIDKEFPESWNAKWRIASHVYSHYLEDFIPQKESKKTTMYQKVSESMGIPVSADYYSTIFKNNKDQDNDCK